MTPSNEVSLPKRQHVRPLFHHHILIILLILIIILILILLILTIILNIKSTLLRDRRCARRSVEGDFSVNTFVRNTLFWTLDFSFSWRLKVQNQLSIMTLLAEIFFQTRFINRMSHFPVQGLSPFLFLSISLECVCNLSGMSDKYNFLEEIPWSDCYLPPVIGCIHTNSCRKWTNLFSKT